MTIDQSTLTKGQLRKLNALRKSVIGRFSKKQSGEGSPMPIDQSTLTKGQIRKLNALRKSVGDDIAEDAFGKWMTNQSNRSKDVRDPVADALVAALANHQDDKSFRLGSKGYVVRRAKGKGASGFVARKVV